MVANVKPSEIYGNRAAVANTLAASNMTVIAFRTPRSKELFISAPDGENILGCIGCPTVDPIGPRLIVVERDSLSGVWE